MIKLMDLIENEQPKPNVMCAWCEAPIRHNPDLKPGEISHGICKKCAKQWNKDLGLNDD